MLVFPEERKPQCGGGTGAVSELGDDLLEILGKMTMFPELRKIRLT